MCFILSAITAVGHFCAIVDTWESINTLSSAPSVKRGGKRHIRGCLRGGPAVARLWPLFFLPGCSGGFLRRRFQSYLGPGSLALREGVASCLAWAPSICLTMTVWHLQLRREMCSLVMRFGSMQDGCRGWPSLQDGRCERVPIRLLEAFQWRIPASAKNGVRRWREEIWDAVVG